MPAYARREIVREGEVGTYHCVQRCVRRAFLCGEDVLTGRSYEHRRAWAAERLEELSDIFAVDVGGYAVLTNHLHAVLRTRPDIAAEWSAEEVARRWWRLCPKRRTLEGAPAEPVLDELEPLLADEARVAELRARLSSLSWFMGRLAEWIARRANREDGCTGRFWEGRFKSQALLDDEAILACAIYVDLNPIRAGIATTPEESRFTSAKDRIDARQAERKLAAANDLELPADVQQNLRREITRDRWLCPIGAASGYLKTLDRDRYLELLDHSGRALVDGKRGCIPSHLQPILERLQIAVEAWLDTVTSFGRYFRRAAGTPTSMADAAGRIGRRWFQGIGHARVAFATG